MVGEMHLVVHPHFHSRRTGVTRHVETQVCAQGRLGVTRALGWALAPSVPRIGFLELVSKLRQDRVVWHAHRNAELLAGILLRLFFPNLRLFFTRHGSQPPGRYTRLLSRAAEAVVTLTPEGARLWESPSVTIGHGIDLESFRPPQDRDEAWRRLGLGGRWGLGVVGRVRKSKGHGDFVEAFAPLGKANPAWRAVFVGRLAPEDRTWARTLISRLEGALSLVPEQAEILPWYQGLTVLVQPSHHESFSLVVAEALAAGCCVVATRLPHFETFIEDGKTGFLYPPGDHASLSKILASLLSDPDLARRVGEEAARRASRLFDADREARELVALYETSVRPSPSSSGEAR